MNNEMVNIGEICGTHGYRGEVKVRLLTDFPERFSDMSQVWLSKDDKQSLYSIEGYRPYRQFLLLKLSGIESKEEAQNLVRGLLQIDEDELYPLPEGTYYIFQLIGLKVDDIEYGHLGTLVEVLQTGANDVYVVRDGPFGEVLIPAIKEVVQKVDLNSKLMRVKLLPGLINEVKP